MATIKKGYDCQFTAHPPVTLQCSCPICKLILREPHQTNCCQTSFCRVCIERVEANNNPCPNCKKRVFNKLHNIELQRALNGLQVVCTNSSQGCRWVGLLGELEGHLNLNPEPAKQPEGCYFASISCIYCFELIQRFNVQVHQVEECGQRPHRCELCNFESTFTDITTNHDCDERPTLCHQCREVFLRKDFQSHVDNDCPMTPIECEFKSVGCKVALPRKDMPAHLSDRVIAHVSLQMASQMKLEKENEKLKEKVNEQEKEVARLTKEVEGLQTLLVTFQSMIQPVQLTLGQYSRQKRKDSDWVSTPFYSHPQGYKMCLRIHANGFLGGKGTHVSVYVHLMKGEFDEHLAWPFRGSIIIQLLGAQGQHEKRVVFDANTPEEYTAQVTKGDRASQGWGDSEFIPHADVDRYLWNDCLIFSIRLV